MLEILGQRPDEILNCCDKTIVIPVASVGSENAAGIIHLAKKRYIRIFNHLTSTPLTAGQLAMYTLPDHAVIFFPVKEFIHRPTSEYMIKQGLKTFADAYKKWGLTSVTFPDLGCLDVYRPVKIQSIMSESLYDIPISIKMFVG